MSTLHSLRGRLILPLLLAAAAATTLVAAVSYGLADSSSDARMASRFAAIGEALRQSNFPLTRSVLRLLADLTSADWFTLDQSGEIIETSLPGGVGQRRSVWQQAFAALPAAGEAAGPPSTIRVGGKVYRAARFAAPGQRRGVVVPQARDVVVLLDDAQRRDTLYRAALAPLATGLSTIVLLTSITLSLAGRLVQRIGRLQRQVEGIAQGNFGADLQLGPQDELGRLATSVRSLADQLNQMWQVLRRRHGQQLLHQIAGGLAHNLRNTLTGARMAIELVQRQGGAGVPAGDIAGSPDDRAGLAVALHQLEQAEDYVQRLLLVARGRQAEPQPGEIGDHLQGLRQGLGNTAKHRGVALQWWISPELEGQRVADVATLLSAVTNLVCNAIEAGRDVRVEASWDQPSGRCRIDVTDDGPGPPQAIRQSLFDPFVTSKPEGIGLGLPLVRGAAESLGGRVEWFRQQGRTIFRLEFPVI